jgi:uncharacterized membrane protein
MVQVIVQSVRRLALKIASYGVMHLVVAILVAFAITRDWRLALAVGVVEPLFQTVAYSIHDRVWHRIERRQTLSCPRRRSRPSAPGWTSWTRRNRLAATGITVTAMRCPARCPGRSSSRAQDRHLRR